MEIRNAKITKVSIGYGGHGILTAMVMLDYGGMTQGFGGYSLDEIIKDEKGDFMRREGSKFGMLFIQKVIDTVGVGSWEELEGKNVRVGFSEDSMSVIESIGHYLDDKWFNPRLLAEVLGRRSNG